MERRRRNAPEVLLGVALVASATLLLVFSSDLTFFQDTWNFLMNRRDLTAEALFDPHNEHIVVIPVAIEQLLVALFGMTSATPEFVLLTLAHLAAAVLLFVYVRRRIGPWPALIAAAALLFLGPAWQDLLWPFEIGFVGSTLFGIAMLLALDRGDRRGDVAACAFLIVSIGFSSLGIPFGFGAAADVLLRRRSHGLARAWVVGMPALLFLAWWLGWGHEADRNVTLTNVLTAFPYAMEGLAAVHESLLGLREFNPEAAMPPRWGLPLLVAALALAALGLARRPRVSPRLWPVAATAAAYWALSAFNYIPGREPYQSRYMYAGAVLVLLLSSELLRGARISRRALSVAGAVAVVAIASNLVHLDKGRQWFEEQAVLTRADLAAIEIARDTVDPSFGLTPEIAGTPSLIDVRADKYLPAVVEHGSPAYTESELAEAPPAGRRQADIVLSQALPLSTETAPGTSPRPGGACVAVPPGPEPAELRLSPGTTRIEVAPGPDASFHLRRFATEEHPVPTEGAPGDSTTLLRIPPDTSERPWWLLLRSEQAARVCR